MFHMPNNLTSATSGHAVPLLVLSFLSFFLAMHGGTPVFHPDANLVLTKAKFAMMNSGNPDFFSYPALMLYLNGVLYWIYEVVLRVVPVELSGVLNSWPYKDIPGHLLTTLFSVIAALSTYCTGYILTRSRYYAAIGALLLITSPLWNADAHFVTVDVPLSALCALTIYVLIFALELQREITIRHIVVLGILVGLTASAKYNGAIIAASVTAALLFRVKPFVHTIRLLALCGLSAITIFMLSNPFILVDSGAFVRDFSFEWNSVATGHPGYTVTSVHYHLSESLYYGWGALLILLSGCGAVLLVMNKEQRVYTKLAILVFPILHLLMLFSQRRAFQRYALPLIPFLAILAMYALFQFGRYFSGYQQLIVGLLSTTVLVVALGANVVQSLRHNLLLRQTDTRSILREIFSENSQTLKSLKIGAGPYSQCYVGVPAKASSNENLGDLDILVMDSFTHDRFIYDQHIDLKVGFSRFKAGKVVAISPFNQKKETVPFSPESLYSPYPPDLSFRTRPGPYIEIYFSDSRLAQYFSEAFLRAGIRNTFGDIQDGYYYQMWRPTSVTKSSGKTYSKG
jgi:dolichyl-phosphate-mannose-protein mannosyltransferase